MPKKAWAFQLEDGSHTVELEHGFWSGKRRIYLDGQLVVQMTRLLDAGSKHPLQIGQHTACVVIGTDGLRFWYDLLVDNVPVAADGSLPLSTLAANAAAVGAGGAASASGSALPADVLNMVSGRQAMLRDIRSWAYWSIGLGLMHLLLSGQLSPAWGITLLLVGLASFVFADAAMYVLYGTTLAWLAISNLASGSGAWIAFALLQAFLAFRVFQQFWRSRKAEQGYMALIAQGTVKDPKAGRTAYVFPWLGCVLGLLSVGGVVVFLVAAVLVRGENVPPILAVFGEAVFNMAVLGLAVSLASLLSRYRYAFLAGLGVAVSALVTIGHLALLFLT